MYVSAPAAVYGERTAIILGFVTLVLALAAFASCRTFMSLILRLAAKDLNRSKTYRRFNRYHAYYWWSFGVAVLAHLMMGAFHTGLPQAGDPDAGVHWAVLILGLTSGISSLTVFASCRVLPGLLAPTLPKFSLTDKPYRSFFGYHSYYWLALALLVAAHFLAVYLHAGVWPPAR